MLAKKTKRFLASLLTAAMVVGLLPMSVLAAGEDTLNPGSKYYDINGAETSESDAKVTLTKNAERTAADEWEVTLSAKVDEIEIEQQPLEVVFVLDVSGSMAWCAEEHRHSAACGYDCGMEEHTHSGFRGGCYEECTRDNHPDHWVWEEGWFDGYWEHVGGTDCESYWGTYYYLTCGKTEHRHNESCYACGKEEHNHDRASGGEPCSMVQSGKAQSRLAIAVSAIQNMVDTLREQLGGKLTAKFVIFSSNGYQYDNGVDKGSRESAKVIQERQLNQLKAEGGTYLSAGVEEGVDQFKSSSARQVLVVVADGDSDDGYPNRTANSFKNDGGIIYTVGFTFSSDSFNSLATDADHALLANSDTELDEAMEDISTDITAMIWDPMGANFSVVPGSAAVSGITDGVLEETGDLITWYPGESQLGDSSDVVTLTYKVKLKDSAKTPGVHTGDPLNGDAELQYKVTGGSEGEPINADFPLPKASYAVGTMTVEYRDIDTNKPIAVLPTDRTITTITDWGEPVFDVNLPAESVPDGANKTWFHVGSKLDNQDYADDAANIAATTGEHTLVRYYELQNSYTVTYQYTGEVLPEGAPAAPAAQTYAEGTVVDVAAEPTLTGYTFSGWTTDDTTVTDGKFTVTGDVTFTGSWEALPYYTVVANFYTNTDNEGYQQDNAEPVPVQSLTYGNYKDYEAAQQQTYNDATYTLNDGETKTETDGLSTVITLRYERSVTNTAEYQVVHEYYVRTDGETAAEPEATVTQDFQGKHGDIIAADSIAEKPQNGLYHYTEDSRSGDITLDKNSKQTITITYVRDRYTVSTQIDENGAITPDTAVYDAGTDVTVSWSANPGYVVDTVTVDGDPSSADGTISFNDLAAAHSVVVTTKPIDYKLHVEYVFTDNSTHEGFEDYTEGTVYHIGESYEVDVPAAPAGYTFDAAASSATSGTFGADDVTVTLVYNPNDKVTATVLFQDENGNTIRDADTVSGLVGQSYDLSAAQSIGEITFNGVRYEFVGDDTADTGADYTGILPEGGVTIIRTYAPLPTYEVTYKPGDHGAFEAQTTPGLYAGDKTPAFAGTPTGEPGWVFDGWSPEVSETVAEGGATYVAQWKEMPKVTVVYQLYTSHNGGAPELTDTVTILDGAYFPLLGQTGPWTYTHNAPDAYDGYDRNDDAAKTTAALTYGESDTLTFRYERETFGSVNYTIRHVYRTLTGNENVVTEDGSLDVPASGTHSSVVTPDDVKHEPGYNGKTYVFNPDESTQSIKLDGSAGQTLTLVYDRHEYVVTVIGDEGVASTSGAGTYAAGSNVTVDWTLNTGYEVESVTVDGVDNVRSGVSLENLQADVTVTIKTKQIDYTVTYFVDGDQYGEVETHHYGDAITMRDAPTAPVGMTFSGWAPVLETMPAENVKIYGTFSYIDYTVSYLPGSHGTFKAENYNGLHYGETTPAFQGETTGEDTWEFAGWKPEVDKTVTGNATYVAQWERSDYTVVVNHVSQESGVTMETSTNQYDVETESTAAPLSADQIPQDFKLLGWEADPAGSVTFDESGSAVINSDKVQTITITYTYGPKDAAYVHINYLLTDGTKDESGNYNLLKPLDMEIKAYRENDAYDVTADVAAFDDAHQMYTRIDADSLTGAISGTEPVIINVYYTADEYDFTVKYFNDYTGEEIPLPEGVTLTAKAPYGTTLNEELVAQYLGLGEDEDWINAMRPANYEDGVVTYITISDDAAKNVVEVHYDYQAPVDPSYNYYRVTVNYLDRADGSKIADSYTSPSRMESSRYDVSEYDAIAINGYTYDATEGDPVSGVLNGNKVINVYYVADEPTNPTDPTDPTDPGDGGEVDIDDGETPTTDLPDIPGGDGDGSGETGDPGDGSGETDIPDGETPTGNLPQTGSVAGQVENRWTLGVLALMASMAAAGLSIVISRRKEEEK